MSRDVIRLELPTPPSINHYFRTVQIKGRGQVTLLSAEGRRFKADAALACQVCGVTPLDGPVSVSLTWRRARKSGDLDNRIKAVLDSLQGFAFHDDKQIVALHAYREDDAARPGCSVLVERVL